MSNENEVEKKNEVLELGSLDDLGAAETAQMTVWLKGQPTNWKWIWAGPGHPNTVKQRYRLDRLRLTQEAKEKQATVNGRKYKADEITPDEDFTEKVNQLLERLIGWTETTVGGQPLTFSIDAARHILTNPSNIQLYIQCWEFLGAENSFTKGSVAS